MTTDDIDAATRKLIESRKTVHDSVHRVAVLRSVADDCPEKKAEISADELEAIQKALLIGRELSLLARETAVQRVSEYYRLYMFLDEVVRKGW